MRLCSLIAVALLSAASLAADPTTEARVASLEKRMTSVETAMQAKADKAFAEAAAETTLPATVIETSVRDRRIMANDGRWYTLTADGKLLNCVECNVIAAKAAADCECTAAGRPCPCGTTRAAPVAAAPAAQPTVWYYVAAPASGYSAGTGSYTYPASYYAPPTYYGTQTSYGSPSYYGGYSSYGSGFSAGGACASGQCGSR